MRAKRMQKLDPRIDGATPDIVEQNLETLRQLFPDAFTEGSDEHGPRWKVDFESLRYLLGDYVEDQQERYSFTWNGKSRARRIAQTPSTGTLRPCPEESVNWDTTQNLFIEGDNLEVLKLLQKSYHKRVKMIYIDPPYNTGNEFIYPDKFQDNLATYLRYTGQVDDEGFRLSVNTETSGRYHTNWLNMMYPRLKLARNLLREDGAIFITIDDNEIANLRKLCDEIYGEENFVATCVWQKRYSRENRGAIGDAHDYVLIYAKWLAAFQESRQLIPLTEDQAKIYKNPNNDPKGRWRAIPMTAQGYRPNQMYGIESPSGQIHRPPEGRCWSMVESEFLKLKAEGRVYFGKDGSSQPSIIRYLSEVNGLVPWTWWPCTEVGHTDESRKEIRAIFGTQTVYDTPKPTRLLNRIIQIAASPNGVILDFFAGSGTTAHSAIHLNSLDGGNRQFILVQLPEPTGREDYKTIAEICKDRIRRVIQNIETEQEKKAKKAKEVLLDTTEDVPDLDLGFKVFKLAASNIKPWDADFDNLEDALFDAVENIKPDRSEADVLYELLLKYGLDLAVPIEERRIEGKTVYIVGAGALIVCLDSAITLETVEGIAALKAELQPEIMRVVFKDAGFKDDVVKTNTVQILKQAGISDVKSL
jgi:adenine-specific DNA-methyltransferase